MGSVGVFGLEDRWRCPAIRALPRAYRDNAVLVTIKALEAAGIPKTIEPD